MVTQLLTQDQLLTETRGKTGSFDLIQKLLVFKKGDRTESETEAKKINSRN